MSTRVLPAVKGVITATLMIALLLILDAAKGNFPPALQYTVYLLYAAGIFWTISGSLRSGSHQGGFGGLFNQGFRCFIVVTLIMVIFTAVFIRMHPEFAEQEAVATREYYMKKGDKTPSEIEEIARKAKKQYPVAEISISIFRYLIPGAVFAGLGAVLLSRRK